MPILKRYEAVEVAIPSGSTNTRFYFPDLPNLRNAMIQAVQLYTAGSFSATPNTGSTMVTEADLKKSFLTLYSGDLQLIYNAPLLAFNNIISSATPNPYTNSLPDIDNMVISWTKSYISLSSAAGTTGVAYAFGVYYKL
jgi:hypothetical protein